MQQTTRQFHTLRGLLALWVLMGHMLLTEKYGTIYNAGFANHNDFGAAGLLAVLHFIAVDIFFMLSGFTLSLRYAHLFTSATKGRDIDRFYMRRIKRIWPLHALTVALVGLMAYVNIPHPISSGAQDVIFNHWQWTLGLNLLLMNGWGIIPVASWNEPSWTLSVTFLLYVLFPNLALLLKRLPQKSWLHLALALALLMGYGIFTIYVPLGSNSDGAGSILRGLVFFLCGMLLSKSDYKLPSAIGIVAFIGAILVWTYVFPFPLTVIHLACLLLLLSLANQHRTVLSAGASQWLGDISFPLFLSHYPTLLMVRYACGAWLQEVAAMNGAYKALCYTGAIGICLLVAELLRRFDGLLHKQKTTS